MSDTGFLWAIFVLLSVLLVIVVVTARRGPWETSLTSTHRFEPTDKGVPIYGSGLPDGAYIYRIDSPTQVTLRTRRKRRWWKQPREVRPLPPVTLCVGKEPVTVEVAFGSSMLKALGPVFRPDQLREPVTGVGVPAGTTLVAVVSSRVAMMSQSCTLRREHEYV